VKSAALFVSSFGCTKQTGGWCLGVFVASVSVLNATSTRKVSHERLAVRPTTSLLADLVRSRVKSSPSTLAEASRSRIKAPFPALISAPAESCPAARFRPSAWHSPRTRWTFLLLVSAWAREATGRCEERGLRRFGGNARGKRRCGRLVASVHSDMTRFSRDVSTADAPAARPCTHADSVTRCGGGCHAGVCQRNESRPGASGAGC